jgi:hypothetical protein
MPAIPRCISAPRSGTMKTPGEVLFTAFLSCSGRSRIFSWNAATSSR